jgi:hypothetical protein
VYDRITEDKVSGMLFSQFFFKYQTMGKVQELGILSIINFFLTDSAPSYAFNFVFSEMMFKSYFLDWLNQAASHNLFSHLAMLIQSSANNKVVRSKLFTIKCFSSMFSHPHAILIYVDYNNHRNCSGVNCAAEELTFTAELINYNVMEKKLKR